MNIKSRPPTTFVDVSAMHDDFGMKFYTDVTQSITHFTTKPGRNLLENDKTMLFQLRQPPFLGILSVDFTGSRLVAEMRMQTWRWRVTADAWSDYHWQPQPCRQSGTW